MEKEGIFVEDFIKETMRKIEAGLGSKYALDGPVNFELSLGVTKEGKGSGSLNIQVLSLDFGKKINEEATQIVQFSVVSKENPDYEAQRLFMLKVRDFLKQPNDKIIEALSKDNAKKETRQLEIKGDKASPN